MDDPSTIGAIARGLERWYALLGRQFGPLSRPQRRVLAAVANGGEETCHTLHHLVMWRGRRKMTALSGVTEAVIRENSSADSFQRGQQYYQQGAVWDLVQRGNVLQAEVAGSEPEPYVISVTLAEDGIAEASCTCPYDWGGWCKHIVATLLAALHTPQAIEQRPPLRDLLAGVDRAGLQTLLLKLVEREPHLVDLLEGHVAPLSPASAPL